MTEQKDELGQIVSKPAPSRKVSATSSAAEPTVGTTANAEADGKPDVTTVTQRKQQYLIGIRRLPGFTAVSTDSILEKLKAMDEVEIVRRLHSRAFQPLMATSASDAQDIVVARMDEQRGEALRLSASPYLIVELDAPLGSAEVMLPGPADRQLLESVLPFPGRGRELRFRVVGDDDRPLARAGVYLYGSGFPVQGVTDASGYASVTLFDIDNIVGESVRAVYVKPAADHWERFIPNPALDAANVNVIRLSPLGKNLAKPQDGRWYGWGQRMMKLDRLSSDLAGAGMKIGLIDSGCDNSHPALTHVTRGVDLTRNNDASSWASDELGQGTHCAGIITGAAGNTPRGLQGISGFSPASELHVFKLVPGGYFSDLIDALDQCIERQIDVVNLGVCSGHGSELVAQKIAEAHLHGVACVVAAGNTSGAVQFPGTVPGVLTVSAVGKLNEFPADTHHAQTRLPQLAAYTGLFATDFSCWGPQVGVCAPGVAIISSVPGGGYAAWDGTALAAAHVTGFAALLFAHHPAFQGGILSARGEQRVSALFEFIRAAAVPYIQADPLRVGAGLPDLQQVPVT